MESFTTKRLSDMTLIEVLQLWNESRKQAEKEKQQKCSTKQDRKFRKALTNHETCERRTEKLASLLRDLQMAGPDDAEFVDFRPRVWTWSALKEQIRILYRRIKKTFPEYFPKMHPDKRRIVKPLESDLSEATEEFKKIYSEHVESEKVDIDYSTRFIGKCKHYITIWNKFCREESQRSDPAVWDDVFISAAF
jgi:hypothetical protein